MTRTIAGAGLILLLLSCSAHAQNIQQGRGIDQQVDYKSLTRFGPWDDRNYDLSSTDLTLLSSQEDQLADPIPAFFRVELRKEFPRLRTTGPAQYPRAAVPLFYRRYGGLIQDGQLVDTGKDKDEGDVSFEQRGLVNGEIKLNQVLGANEVTIEINPANPLQVIAGSNNNGGQEMYYSTDGGANWTIQGTLPDTCCDPTIDWKSDGSIAYVAALSGAIGVSVWRSFDGGQSWGDRLNITSGGSDKEFIHVDRSQASIYRDSVYLTYHNGNVMQFARSTDDGATFDTTAFGSAPIGIGSDITTDASGNIYYVYASTAAQDIVLLKSTDGGDSFNSPVTVSSTNATFDFPIPAMETRRAWIYAAADADRSGGTYEGNIYVAWTDTTAPESGSPANNHTTIQVARSSDGGASWQISNPHPMNDTATVDRFNQWLKVDEVGNVHVVYYDTQHSVNRTGVDLYYNVSTDGGVSWGTPQRVSSATSANLTDGQEWGDYNGLSVFSALALPAWTDNRDGPPNSKDVYVAQADNEEALPTFQLSAGNLALQSCKPDSPGNVDVDVVQILGFSDPVTMSWDALPTGFSGSFTVNPVNPPGSTQAGLTVNGSASAGDHLLGLQGTSGSITQSMAVQVTLFDAAPGATTLTAPVHMSTVQTNSPLLQWNSVAGAASYTVEIDDDPGFGSIDFMAATGGTSLVAGPLASDTTWFWKVRATNPCGAGVDSAVFSFDIPTVSCSTPNLAIPDGSGMASDDISGFSGGLIQNLSVSLRISHTYVGDLIARLTHVDDATEVNLLDRPGVPASIFGCSANDVDATFDDSASNPAEDECGSDPAIGGVLAPAEPLSAFNGQETTGTWRLTVSDSVTPDAGTVEEWCLAFDADPPLPDKYFGDGFED